MKALCSPLVAALLCATPVLASVTVIKPISSASVTSPFTLTASASPCSSQSIAAMGYSLDTSSNTTVFKSTSISTNVTAPLGTHVLHVKSWGNHGSSCVTSISIDVVSVPASGSGPSIPSDAKLTNAIQNVSAWTAHHDAATSGTTSGDTQLVTSPSLSGSARKFATSYTNYGGERYNVHMSVDQVSTHFVYDARIYIAHSASDIANIEMDLNQVTTNGQTIIFGFQCDGWSDSWDYTINSGTSSNPKAHWIHTNQSCSPHKWSTDAWHHVQVEYSRDNSGNVTYSSVWLDGVEQDINATVSSAFDLGWAPSFNSNFQVDGYTSTSGSSTIYVDNLKLYSW